VEVKPTRIRRLRIRRAIGRAATAACLIAGTLLAVEVSGVALPVGGPSPAVHLEVSPAGSAGADGQAADVGIWVVEGSEAAPVAEDPAVLVGQSLIAAARVVVQGKDHDVTTNAATVGQLLAAMGIKPEGNDRVSPPPRTPLQEQTRIVFVDVTFKVKKVDHQVPYQTVTDYTTSVAPGEVKITREGQSGRAVWTVRQRYEDGHLVGHRTVGKKIVRQPVSKVRSVGTFTVSNKGRTAHTETGTASWYDHPGMTAASPWLALGTHVTVTDLSSGKSVTVVINDRGPFGGGIIDLSKEAFAQLAPTGAGLIQVRLDW